MLFSSDGLLHIHTIAHIPCWKLPSSTSGAAGCYLHLSTATAAAAAAKVTQITYSISVFQLRAAEDALKSQRPHASPVLVCFYWAVLEVETIS